MTSADEEGRERSVLLLTLQKHNLFTWRDGGALPL